MDNNNSNIIELKHINRTFEDGFKAVEDFNLEVKRGEFVIGKKYAFDPNVYF